MARGLPSNETLEQPERFPGPPGYMAARRSVILLRAESERPTIAPCARPATSSMLVRRRLHAFVLGSLHMVTMWAIAVGKRSTTPMEQKHLHLLRLSSRTRVVVEH